MEFWAGFWETMEESCREVWRDKESSSELVMGQEDEAQGREGCFQDRQAGSCGSSQRKTSCELSFLSLLTIEYSAQKQIG